MGVQEPINVSSCQLARTVIRLIYTVCSVVVKETIKSNKHRLVMFLQGITSTCNM